MKANKKKLIILGIIIIVGFYVGGPVICLPEKEKLRVRQCMDNLVEIGEVCRAYANDHDGRFPDTFSQIATGKYTLATKTFICRGSQKRPGKASDVDQWSGYHLVTGITLGHHPRKVLAYDQPEHHRGDGAPVLFVDGSVSWVFAKEWTNLVAKGRED